MTLTAPAISYIPLRVHSEYSISDGIVRIDELIDKMLASNVPAVALTDLGNIFGAVKFYQAARKKGIKPIIGCDCWIGDPDHPERHHRLLLLVKNHRGYQQLCRLLTDAYQNRTRAASIPPEKLSPATTDGLIALSGAADGDVGQALASGQMDLAAKCAKFWQSIFPQSYYLELQRYGQAREESLSAATLSLAESLNLPVVATHPIQFLNADEFTAHEARVCIAEGTLLDDNKRNRHFLEAQYFLRPEEMWDKFSDCPGALANSVAIAERCNLELTLGKNFLPDFPVPKELNVEQFLHQQAINGLEYRLAALFPDEEMRRQSRPPFDERLEIECQMINRMGFPGYFLIVAEFINWAKENNIPVGPGRGSGAGSLVAYCLGITDLNPLDYALLFERFLNPERVSMPDFDIDFCQFRRGEVIEHVRERYGSDAVSQIITFGTMSSKAVIRDVGRVLGMSYTLCDRLSKMIPVEQNKPLGLAEALEREPMFQEMMQDGRDGAAISELFVLARQLEGLTRNVGTHAGGVLIAKGSISDYCPVWRAGDASTDTVSQLDKDDVEKIGLVKFDFLGLRNLTIIQSALEHIKRQTGSTPDWNVIGYADSKVYALLRAANTTAIFQLESEGMKKLLKKLEPDRFEDIIAVLALFRPGPLGSGMVDDFILRKKGKQRIDYFHPNLQSCLEPTYGVIVYQEQVMQISQIIGGYTLGEADMLRRAMGKKKPEEMASHRQKIAQGAESQGYSPQLAEQLFDLMLKFAEYGFNKSHTAAYAVITFQTAWLKTYYPAAFMAATLSSDMHNTDSIKLYYDDCLHNNLRLLPPDINRSQYEFMPIDERQILYGLGGLKGVGEMAVRNICKVRQQGGPFTDLYDFCRRVDKRQVNRRNMESMIRAGAFDQLPNASRASRSTFLAELDSALTYAERCEQNSAQLSLFGDNIVEELPQTSVPAWSEVESLQQEKLALGFYLSGHPFNAYRDEIKRFVPQSLLTLEASNAAIQVAGMLVSVKIQSTRRGKMAVLALDDGSAQREVTVFNELYQDKRDKLQLDQLIIVSGRATYDEYTERLRLNAKDLLTLAEARLRYAQYLSINLQHQFDAATFKAVITPYLCAEGLPIRISYQNDQARCTVVLGNHFRVNPTEALCAALNEKMGNHQLVFA